MPYSGGLQRNIVQCLDDFGIPLKVSTTVLFEILEERVEAVTLAKVGNETEPKSIPGTGRIYPRALFLALSVGLIPECPANCRCHDGSGHFRPANAKLEIK